MGGMNMTPTRFHVTFKKLEQVLGEDYLEVSEDISADIESVQEIRQAIEEYTEPQLVKFTST